MPLEIERKFLVDRDSWRLDIESTVTSEDHLIARFELGKARIRICNDSAKLTLKGNRAGIVRSEFHQDLTADDAEAMLAEFSTGRSLLKRRHSVRVGNLTWQVDEFLGPLAGLTTADVESPTVCHPLELPSWAGPEITGNRRYSSSVLAGLLDRKPSDILDHFDGDPSFR